MTGWAAVAVKIRRFEFVAALLLALGAAIWASITWYAVNSLNVPPACIDNWLIDGPATRPECASQMFQWGALVGGAGDQVFGVMAVLPFAVGLLAGTPIVARELEAGTAQTAWWLYGSRATWFVRQLVAIGLPLLIVMSLAAFATGLLTALDHAWGQPAFIRIGIHGPDAVARAAAAFGVSVLVGAFAGRTLPAFIGAAALVVVMAIGISFARDSWVGGLELTATGVTDPATGEIVVQPRSVFATWGWLAPDGTISRVERQGFEYVMLGVSEEAALKWEPLETLGYGAIATLSILAAALAVRSRRPL